MLARYAKSYIDQLYEAKDAFELRGIVGVVQMGRRLPEQFSVFAGLIDWLSSSRSGIYQYYECMEHRDRSEFDSLADGLSRFGFPEIAERYRSGMATWREGGCDELDRWIDEHRDEIETTAFQLIAENRACLYGDAT
jgi:hypothetical protein